MYSFVLSLVGYLALCILVVGGATFEYMCDIIVEWMMLCFEIAC